MQLRWAFLFLLILNSACKPRERFVDELQIFPALTGDDKFSLAAVDAQLRFLVVNFYAPDCPPCEKEVPALKTFAAKHASDKETRFVAIGSSLRAVGQENDSPKGSVTHNEIVSELIAFARKFKLSYPQFVADGAQLKSWRVTGFPETFVFERSQGEWQLNRKLISEITFEQLEQVTSGIRN